MTYSLVVGSDFKGAYPTLDEAKQHAESISGQSLEWDRYGRASFINPENLSHQTAKVTQVDNSDNYKLNIRAWPNSLHGSPEEVIQKLGRSERGERSGFLTDWIEIPHLRKWVALFWDMGMGVEIATLTKIR